MDENRLVFSQPSHQHSSGRITYEWRPSTQQYLASNYRKKHFNWVPKTAPTSNTWRQTHQYKFQPRERQNSYLSKQFSTPEVEDTRQERDEAVRKCRSKPAVPPRRSTPPNETSDTSIRLNRILGQLESTTTELRNDAEFLKYMATETRMQARNSLGKAPVVIDSKVSKSQNSQKPSEFHKILWKIHRFPTCSANYASA